MQKITVEEINEFEHRIEDAGFNGALEFTKNVLVPLAESQGIDLLTAAELYVDSGADQDTSEYQLWLALVGGR